MHTRADDIPTDPAPAPDADVLAALFEGTPQGVCEFDAEWRYVRVNRRAEEILRTPRADLLGRRMLDVFPAFADDPAWPAMRRAAADGVAVDVRLYWPPFDAWFDVRTGRGAGPGRTFVFFQDVTAGVRAEAALRQSEARFRTTADASPQLVWTVTMPAMSFWGNRRWCEYLGVGPEQVASAGWAGVFRPEHVDAIQARWNRSVTSGEPYEVEAEMRRHDGPYRWHLIRALPARDDAGAITQWCGTCTDIHDLTVARAALRDADQRPNVAAAALPVAAAASGKLRVLLVDDHDDTLGMLQRLLTKRGFEVDCARGVEEAALRLSNRPADVLVSDIGLPDGTGHDLMRRARATRPTLVGIAASGHGAVGDVRTSEEAGFAAHLTKPIDLELLIATIQRVLRTDGAAGV